MKYYRDPLDIWIRRNPVKADILILSIIAFPVGLLCGLVYAIGTGAL